jgi:hypothetical protein
VKTSAAKKPPPKDEVEFLDLVQGSPEWFEARKGIPTASRFALVMASGKDGGDSVGRDKYMKQLAGEIVTGQIAEELFKTDAMARGNRMEPEARDWYERTHLVDLTPVGFVKRTVRVPLGKDFECGASPDSMVNPRKGLEIKTMAPHLLGDLKDRGAAGFPTAHKAQIHGTMLVCDWDEIDLVIYYTGWPKPPIFRVQRDDTYIAQLKAELEKFDFELQRIVERWKR